MKTWVAFIVLAGCAGSVHPAGSSAPTPVGDSLVADATVATASVTKPAFDYCGMIFASLGQAVARYRKDVDTLETPCVQRNVTAGGVWYAEAVGFDPMPTLTCKSASWIVQIGEAPPRAPTDAVVLIGFGEGSDERRFYARVERSDWRKQPNRVSNYGCGTVEGTARRDGSHWVARLTAD